jgi:hypothetical protein
VTEQDSNRNRWDPARSPEYAPVPAVGDAAAPPDESPAEYSAPPAPGPLPARRRLSGRRLLASAAAALLVAGTGAVVLGHVTGDGRDAPSLSVRGGDDQPVAPQLARQPDDQPDDRPDGGQA